MLAGSPIAASVFRCFFCSRIFNDDLSNTSVGFGWTARLDGPTGQIVGRFDKIHRVPFGEYIPFRSLVERVDFISAAGSTP